MKALHDVLGKAMTDAVVNAEEDAPVKKSKLPLIIGVVLAIAGGGGGFFAVSSGLLPFGQSAESEETHVAEKAPEGVDSGESAEDIAQLAFIEMEPIVITLRKASGIKHLRFNAQLEVDAIHQAEVEKVLPRVVVALRGPAQRLQQLLLLARVPAAPL